MKYAKSVLFFFSFALLATAASAQKKKDTEKKYSEEDRLKINSLFFEGQREKLIGNLDKASTYFLKAVEIDENHGASLYELALIEVKSKRFIEALPFAERAYGSDQNNIWYGRLLVEVLKNNNEYKKADKIYDLLSDQHPEERDLILDHAELLLRMSEYKSALKELEKLENEHFIVIDLLRIKKGIFQAQNKEESFFAELEKARSRFPQDNELKLFIAKEHLQAGKVEQAKADLEKLVEQDSQNVQALLLLSEVFRKEGKQRNSENFLLAAFALPQMNIDRKVQYIVQFLPMIGIDSGIRDLLDTLSSTVLLTHPEDPRSFALRADFLSQTNRFKEAQSLYVEALSFPEGRKKYLIWQQLMFIEASLGEYVKLEEHSEEAIEYFPNQTLSYYLNGVAKSRRGNYQDAIEILNIGLDFAYGDDAMKEDIYTALGEAYFYSKNYEQSDQSFDHVLKLNPNNALVLNNYSYYLSLRGQKLEKALEMSRKANDLVPNSASYLDTYAWILYKKGMYKEALEWVDKALQSGGESNSEVMEHKGDILFKLNEKAEALSWWQKALDANSENSEELQKKIRAHKLP